MHISIEGERLTQRAPIERRLRHARGNRRVGGVAMAICVPWMVAILVWMAIEDGVIKGVVMGAWCFMIWGPVVVTMFRTNSKEIRDLEVLWYLVQGTPPLHRFWHTCLGATVVAAVLAVAGKPASQVTKSVWNGIARQGFDVDLTVSVGTSWPASVSGAVVGAYSHILLDSLVHADMEPWQPWSGRQRPSRARQPGGA